MPGHRSYRVEGATIIVEPRVSAALLIERLADDGQLTAESIRFIEDNVFELDGMAMTAQVPEAYSTIQDLFGTDHVTTEMIVFYEQNFWQ